jgi:hypothetical protein
MDPPRLKIEHLKIHRRMSREENPRRIGSRKGNTPTNLAASKAKEKSW